MELSVYLYVEKKTHFYQAKYNGEDLDIYEAKNGTLQMIASRRVKILPTLSVDIIMQYLPIAHVPPLTTHQDTQVREAALRRMSQ